MRLLAICFLFFATVASADDVNLRWDPVSDTRCAGYVVQISTDYQTWTDVWSTGDPMVGEATISDVQGNSLVYFRMASLNAAGDKFPMNWSGAWYDGSHRPVSPPGGAGIH